jgi:hypothetical protein
MYLEKFFQNVFVRVLDIFPLLTMKDKSLKEKGFYLGNK